MVKSIATLKKERDRLLRGAKKKDAFASTQRAQNLERKKINAEIKALKNPGSVAARRSFLNASRKVGSFLSKRGAIINANLNRMAAEEARKSKKKSRR